MYKGVIKIYNVHVYNVIKTFSLVHMYFAILEEKKCPAMETHITQEISKKHEQTTLADPRRQDGHKKKE